MSRHRVGRIDGAEQVRAPAHRGVAMVEAELQPVQHVGIGAHVAGRVHVAPVGEGGAVPGARQGAQVAVLGAQPAAKGLCRGRAKAGIGRVVALVPDIVPAQARVILVSLGQGAEEALGRSAVGGMIQAQPGEAAQGRAGAQSALHTAAVTGFQAGIGVDAESPLRRGGDHLGDDRLEAVLGGQVELAVIVVPVVDARGYFDSGPQEPVPEDVHAVLGGGAIVALPVLPGRVGLAEVDRPVGEGREGGAGHGQGPFGMGCPGARCGRVGAILARLRAWPKRRRGQPPGPKTVSPKPLTVDRDTAMIRRSGGNRE